MGESYGEGLDLGRIAGAFIVNSLMRIVGFATRLIVLAIGAISYLSLFVFSVTLFLIWITAPFILMGSLILSATFFIV